MALSRHRWPPGENPHGRIYNTAEGSVPHLAGTVIAPRIKMRRTGLVKAVLTVALLSFVATATAGEISPPVEPEGPPVESAPSGIRDLLGTSATGNLGDHPIIADAVRAFYEERNHERAWTTGAELSVAARRLVNRVSRAQRDGLAPLRSLPDVVDSLLEAQRLDRLDVLLTQVFLTYGLLLGRGQVAPEAVHRDWHADVPPPPEMLPALTAAVADGNVDGALDALAPPGSSYHRLREALGRYLDVEAAGGWEAVPDGPLLKPGAHGHRVRVLRTRLQFTGDLAKSTPADGTAPEAYDGDVAAAVRRFQARHGLPADGIVGPVTVAALNVPVATRVRQIALNMERHRWLPPLEPRRVSVNIAAQQLIMFDDGREIKRMRVVTGQAYTPTPVLADRISHIVVNPYWHVPRSIAAQEILPEVKKEPGHLLRRGIQILTGHDDEAEEVAPWAIEWASLEPDDFPYVLRQAPGGDNPLGRLKFMFPNRFAVYLHDTPAPTAFDGLERARSRGCVRVERPLTLAAFALGDDPRWPRNAIERAIASGEQRRIDLTTELPVYLLYWTAWADPDGTVNFREDLYGFDEQLTLALMGLAS